MGKLYDTEGKRVEDLFLKMGRTYEGDPTNWKQEAAVQGIRHFPQGVGKPKGSKEPDTSEVLDTSEEKLITRVIGMAIKEEPKDEDIPTKTRRFTRSHLQKTLTETIISSSQTPELLEAIDLCSSDEGEKMEEGDIVMTPTVVQPRKEPTTEVPPVDDDDEESSSSSDDDDDDGDYNDDGEDLFDIEELQEIYEKQKASKSKDSEPMEEAHKEMDASEATKECRKAS